MTSLAFTSCVAKPFTTPPNLFHNAERGMIPPFFGSPLPGESGSPTYGGHSLGVGLGLVPLCPSIITLLNRK